MFRERELQCSAVNSFYGSEIIEFVYRLKGKCRSEDKIENIDAK